MKIYELEEKHFKSLSSLILQVYDEMPFATTFDSRPSEDELANLMKRKIQGMRDRTLVDFVAVEGEEVIADCEIAKTTDSGGTIGIIVAKEHRRKGLGKRLVEKCIEKTGALKLLEVYAEIDERNEGVVYFFSKCGFREQEGEENLVMIRNL